MRLASPDPDRPSRRGRASAYGDPRGNRRRGGRKMLRYRPDPGRQSGTTKDSHFRRRTMRFLLKVNIPVETGNAAAKAGKLGSTIHAILADLKPEAAYFSDDRGQRTGYLIVDMQDAGRFRRSVSPGSSRSTRPSRSTRSWFPTIWPRPPGRSKSTSSGTAESSAPNGAGSIAGMIGRSAVTASAGQYDRRASPPAAASFPSDQNPQSHFAQQPGDRHAAGDGRHQHQQPGQIGCRSLAAGPPARHIATPRNSRWPT